MAFDGPRLRRDLVSTIFEQDGVRCVDVHDPRRGSTFRLFGYEYSVALAFDGRPLAKVIPWVRLSTGLQLTAEQLTAFAERLDQLGFLESHMARTTGGVPQKTPAPVRRTVEWAPVTREPASSEPLTGWMPVPIPSQPEIAEDDAPAPPPALSQAFPATESRPATAEPTPPEAEAATTEMPSSDVLPAGEPPAAVATPSPDEEPAEEPRAAAATPSPDEEPAAEARAAVATPSPDEERAEESPAAVATPSSDVLPAGEPPAAVATPSPDEERAEEPPAAVATPSPDEEPAAAARAAVLTTPPPDDRLQAQPWLPATDITPAPVKTPPPEPASPPVETSPAQPVSPSVEAPPPEPVSPPVETLPPEPASPSVETLPPEPASPSVEMPPPEPASPSVEAPPPEPASPSVETLPPEPASPSVEAPPAEPVSPPVEVPPAQPASPPVETLPPEPASPPVETLPPEPASPPVETSPAQPASPPVQEPLPVPVETLTSGVLQGEPPPIPPEARTPPPLRELPPRGRMSAAQDADATGRGRAVQSGSRMLTPGPRRMLTPPPLRTPGVTPAPLRSTAARGGSWTLYALLGTLAALAVGVLVVPLAVRTHPPADARARVLVVKPAAVLRWFDGTALLESLPSEVLSFPAGGKVIRIASPGSALRPGDVVAATDAARSLLADLARLQERLAYFEQLAEGMRDTGDEKRVAAARDKVELGAELVGQAQAALSRAAIVAAVSGQVEATLASLGQSVRAGAPAVRLRSTGWRANFELPRPLVARVRKQGFCAAEIEGQPIGCRLIADGGDETHVAIELAPKAATAAGRPVRLARARFADAFLVPASALSRVGDSDRVLVVAPTGRAEARSVVVADRSAADAVITQGLDAGDAIIVETSQPVGAGAQVRIAEAMRE